MIKWIVAVLGFQLVGEVSAAALHLPVPGPVLGMMLLFGLLLRIGGPPTALQRLSDGLLNNLYLFFIPAAVGVTTFIALVADQLVAIVTAVLVSSVLAMVITGLLMQALARKDGGDAV